MSKIIFASMISVIICLVSCKKSDDSVLLAPSEQFTKKDSVIVNNQDLNIDKITLPVKGKLVDCNGKPLQLGGVSYSIIYKNGLETFRAIADVSKDGLFDFSIFFNKSYSDSYLDKIRIVAFDISGEKESVEQFISLKAGINDIGTIKVCNPLSEYIKVTAGLGKTVIYPSPLLSICRDSLCFLGSTGTGLSHFMISTAKMSLPLKSGIYDGYITGMVNEENLRDNATTMIPNAKVTYSKIADKIGEYYEGSYEGKVFNGKEKVECKGIFRYRKKH
jgi:hypothetical protein